MENNNNTNIIKVVIALVMIAASAGVYFFFDIPKMNEAKSKEAQIDQMGVNITSRQQYYEGVNNQMTALETAGWAEKRKSIEANFISGPFYISKMKYFMSSLAKEGGVTLNSVTYSSPTTVKTQVQTKATEGAQVKTSKEEKQSESTAPAASSYFDQLKGAINKTTFNLSITGNYASINNFFKTLEGQTRVGTVQSVKISSSSSGATTKGKATASNLLTADIVVDFYSY